MQLQKTTRDFLEGPTNKLDDSLSDMNSHFVVPQHVHTQYTHCHMKTKTICQNAGELNTKYFKE